MVATLRAALRDGRRLRLRYVDASDVVSEREVDPWQLLTGDERSYLQAWCHSAGGERLFRLDRVLAAEVLDEPMTRRPGPAPSATFRPSDEHERVVIELDGRARWVAEQLPVDEVTELLDGGFRVSLRAASSAWLRHLLLQLAGHVRAVDPPHLASDAADAAARALAAYGDVEPLRPGGGHDPAAADRH